LERLPVNSIYSQTCCVFGFLAAAGGAGAGAAAAGACVIINAATTIKDIVQPPRYSLSARQSREISMGQQGFDQRQC
jgi:hypothetical protein